MTMIGFFQEISIMNNSSTVEGLYIMVNSVQITSRRRERQRRHALSMQTLPSLMTFLGNEIQQYPSSPTRINAVSIWSVTECGMSSPFQTHAIKIRSGIFFYISLYFPWNTWNAMYRVFRKALRQISILFRTWCGQECTWGGIFKYSSSEGTDIGATDINRTWSFCCHHDYISLRFLWCFGRDSYSYEES